MACASVPADKIPLTFLLIGNTKRGKSEIGNSILGKKKFQASSTSRSTIDDVKDAWAETDQYEIKVVDSLTFKNIDTLKDKNDSESIIKALTMCSGGVNAFLFVMKYGETFTDEDKIKLFKWKQILGEDFLKTNGIILVTHFDEAKDEFTWNGDTVRTKIESDLGSLVDECSGRIMLFVNMEEDIQKQQVQRNILLKMTEKLTTETGPYTNELFTSYSRLQEKLIGDMKLPLLIEDVRKKISLLTEDLINLTDTSSVTDIDEIEKKIIDVLQEFKVKFAEYKQLNKDVESLLKQTRTLKASVEAKKKPSFSDKCLGKLKQLAAKLDRKIEISWKKIFLICGLVLLFGIIIGISVGIAIGLGASVSVAAKVAAAVPIVTSLPGNIHGLICFIKCIIKGCWS